MHKINKGITLLNTFVIISSLIVTICGVCSFHNEHSYEIMNQYGQCIRIWGAGIYAHDSYFKAPIFIGSDFTVLVVVNPLLIISFRRLIINPLLENFIDNFAMMSLLLYYSASLAFGVTYNSLHLIYIAFFGACFYCTALLFAKLYTISDKQNLGHQYHLSKGLKTYLILSGICLYVAWLPDIVISLINKTSLTLIEVYTTEITYVLDMGIISPLIFLTLYLLNQKNFIGYV